MQHDAILITGGAGGIGRAIARRATEAGWRPVILDLHAPADPLPNEVFIRCDFADAAEARAALAEAATRHAPTRLVNNVGIVRPALLEDTSVEDLAAVLDVNLRSAILAAQALLPAMRDAGFGRIVNIASRAALGKELRTAYAASKAGLIGMTKSIAKELASRNILANVVAPGFIETDMTAAMTPEARTTLSAGIPLARLGTPEDIAGMVLVLASDLTSYVTGQVFVVDGGLVM